MAFFGSYIFHGLLIYGVVRRISGFRWSVQNTRRTLFFAALTAVVFTAPYLLPSYAAIALSALATLASAAYSLYVLLHLVARDRLPPLVRRLLPST
jgi:PST family polysaccharide transporter